MCFNSRLNLFQSTSAVLTAFRAHVGVIKNRFILTKQTSFYNIFIWLYKCCEVYYACRHCFVSQRFSWVIFRNRSKLWKIALRIQINHIRLTAARPSEWTIIFNSFRSLTNWKVRLCSRIHFKHQFGHIQRFDAFPEFVKNKYQFENLLGKRRLLLVLRLYKFQGFVEFKHFTGPPVLVIFLCKVKHM
jgi:hypothetical protein